MKSNALVTFADGLAPFTGRLEMRFSLCCWNRSKDRLIVLRTEAANQKKKGCDSTNESAIAANMALVIRLPIQERGRRYACPTIAV
jgi:hypothetical protein